jgi:hypothetical protein
LCHRAFGTPITDFYALEITNLHDVNSSPSRFFEDYEP